MAALVTANTLVQHYINITICMQSRFHVNLKSNFALKNYSIECLLGPITRRINVIYESSLKWTWNHSLLVAEEVSFFGRFRLVLLQLISIHDRAIGITDLGVMLLCAWQISGWIDQCLFIVPNKWHFRISHMVYDKPVNVTCWRRYYGGVVSLLITLNSQHLFVQLFTVQNTAYDLLLIGLEWRRTIVVDLISR